MADEDDGPAWSASTAEDGTVWLLWQGPTLVAVCASEEVAEVEREERFMKASEEVWVSVRIESRPLLSGS